jgi:hypothetical protein
MPQRSRETFEQILAAVTPQNIQALEHEAHTASTLAVIYPRHEGVFHAIESKALQQILRILAELWAGELGPASGSDEDRSASIPSPITYEKERGFRR